MRDFKQKEIKTWMENVRQDLGERGGHENGRGSETERMEPFSMHLTPVGREKRREHSFICGRHLTSLFMYQRHFVSNYLLGKLLFA